VTRFFLFFDIVYGAYHALETISQLMQFNFVTETYYIPNCPWTIVDYPRFPHRGLLIDSSRHFQPVQTIKNVIDSITYAKLNTIHWHIVDEQAFPFDSPSYPQLAGMGAYSNYERYTVDDVAQVIEYARERGVRVMVEVGKQKWAVSKEMERWRDGEMERWRDGEMEIKRKQMGFP
jgi:hexosaminidase